MDSSPNEVTSTPGSDDAKAPPVRLAFDADAKKHFDAFEALFFQQGEEADLPGAYDPYDDGEPRIKRWLPYRTLMGISIASTTIAVIACVALWRNNAPAPLTAVTPTHVAAPAPVAVAPAAPAPAAPALAVEEPAPTDPTAAPAPNAAAPAAPVAAAAPAVAAPTPSEPVAAAAPAVPAPAPSAPAPSAAPEPVAAPAPAPSAAIAAKAAEPPPAPVAEQPAPAVAQVAPPRAAPEKTKAEAPVAAAAPTENEARARCRQSIRDRKAKDIVAVCSAAFEQDATDADAAVAVAKVEFDRGRFTQAYNWSKKAIAVNPAAADAYVYAGGAEQNQGHGKAAKEAYLQYLRLAPSGRYAAELRTIVNSL